MRKIIMILFAGVLCLGFTSCSGDDDNGGDKKAVGNGIYIINGHRFVDLGLPSGLLWAETNIGAATAADDGNYYAWGETSPKSVYHWENYKYSEYENYGYDDYPSTMTKYNSTDGKTTLDKEDDAAYVNWGAPCRMPTKAQFGELLNSNNCTWQWTSKTTSNGSSINGYVVVSVRNGNSIFLPASGYCYNEDPESYGTLGEYLSSTLNDPTGSYSYIRYAYKLGSGSSHTKMFSDQRCYGQPVRPVVEP